MGLSRKAWRGWLAGLAVLPLTVGGVAAQVAAPEKPKTEKPAEKKSEAKPQPKPEAAKDGKATPADQTLVPLKDSSKYLLPFKAAVAAASKATVAVLSEGKVVCLGTIVSPDGYVLTKASELKNNVVCKLRDGRTFAAELVGIEDQNDLALLRIPAKGLPTIQWVDSSEAEVGDWVCTATTSDEPAAVGVVSVASHVAGPQISAMIRAFLAGELATALARHEQLLPLCKALFATTNPIPVKAALEMTGWPVGAPRLPLLPASDAVKQRLSETLAALRPT